MAGFGKMYRSTKFYGHDQGLSCCFRQWRAVHSHCRLLHGYAIAVKLTFVAATLDERMWVEDFGGLKKVKDFLKATFDHKTVVAQDDPSLSTFVELHEAGLIDLVILPAVGCEAFAQYIHEKVCDILAITGTERVDLESVEVMEHTGNSAIYAIN